MRWLHRVVVTAVLAVTTGCGDDGITPTTTTIMTTTTTTTATTTTTTTTTSTSTTTPVPVEQPAVWPAADIVMTSPAEAARDFMEQVLEVPAELGEFRQGDQRSGEIEVFVRTEGEGSTQRWPRAVLFLRQLGPSDGWFVIGAATEHVTIDQPAVGTDVPAGPLIVEGVGRGFEATMVVTAFLQGRSDPLDQKVTFAGSLDIAQPYRTELDLSGASQGDVVAIIVRGGVGLETDPGEFTVVPYRVRS